MQVSMRQKPANNTWMTAKFFPPRRNGATSHRQRPMGRPVRIVPETLEQEMSPPEPQGDSELNEHHHAMPCGKQPPHTSRTMWSGAGKETLTARRGPSILPLRFISRWTGRYIKALKPRSKRVGDLNLCHERTGNRTQNPGKRRKCQKA